KTFKQIAKSMGRLVMMDDITEENSSFSVARMLIDSFQWELISEWIAIKVNESEFEVFVKEFGGEVYNVQSHSYRLSNTEDPGGNFRLQEHAFQKMVIDESMEKNSNSVSVVQESLLEVEDE
ncbi:hypothetical protein PIB30_111542, partial [Stylosanthes scabra]|nr:hypothetical protein [Stylosanthes scabra]